MFWRQLLLFRGYWSFLCPYPSKTSLRTYFLQGRVRNRFDMVVFLLSKMCMSPCVETSLWETDSLGWRHDCTSDEEGPHTNTHTALHENTEEMWSIKITFCSLVQREVLDLSRRLRLCSELFVSFKDELQRMTSVRQRTHLIPAALIKQFVFRFTPTDFTYEDCEWGAAG